MRFLEHRIGATRMLRLAGKWLKAGVLEEGRLLTVERGRVQRWGRLSAQGQVIVVRYADDMVVADAVSFWTS